MLHEALARSVAAADGRFGIRVLGAAIDGDAIHVDLVASIDGDLVRASRGLAVRIARNANRAAGRRGQVLVDRVRRSRAPMPRVREAAAPVVPAARRRRGRSRARAPPPEPPAVKRVFGRGWEDEWEWDEYASQDGTWLPGWRTMLQHAFAAAINPRPYVLLGGGNPWNQEKWAATMRAHRKKARGRRR